MSEADRLSGLLLLSLAKQVDFEQRRQRCLWSDQKTLDLN